MRIGDLIYQGRKIRDIVLSCEHTDCTECRYENFCGLIEVELPPIIKAADVATDAINPKHYKTSKYECIDVMIDIFGVEAVKTFCKLNAFKYIWRTDNKNGVEDIEKAQAYIDKYIELNNKEDEKCKS